MAGEASRQNGKKGGRPLGTKNQSTIDKELHRELLRQQILAEMQPMTAAQMEHARGISYMILRNPDGSFARATDVKQIDAACAVGASAFRIFTQAPNTAAYADLMNRALDKPAEQVKHTGPDDGPIQHLVTWKRKSSK